MTKIFKQPIGYIKAEGTGPDIIEAALSILKTIERINDIKFTFVGYKGQAPALEYTTKSFEQLKKFYSQIREEKGCIIRGGIYARQVYKLRNDFNLTFKPILIDPIPELFENSPFREKFAKKINLLLIRENAQGLLMSTEKLRKIKKEENSKANFIMMNHYAKNLLKCVIGKQAKGKTILCF